MEPLITIETIPISIEYTVNRSKSKPDSFHSDQSAKLRVQNDGGRARVKGGDPIRVQLPDRFESGGRTLSYTAANARYSEIGRLQMDVRFSGATGASDEDDAANATRFRNTGGEMERMVDAMPKAAPADPLPLIGSMSFDFDMSKLAPRTTSGSSEYEFTPPDIELHVIEYPKVIIKYVGGPIYFPASADPNYTPPPEGTFGMRV